MSKQGPLAKHAVLPAHKTKHIAELDYTFLQSTFRLSQLDSGHSNGTALWLGAQCLSAFLAHVYGNKHRAKQADAAKRPRVIELGSGIGLSALLNGTLPVFLQLLSLALSSLGWDVVATDLPEIIDTVLARNIANNIAALPPDSGTIQVRALDWTVLPDLWSWDNARAIASATGIPSPLPAEGTTLLAPPFDLIITADTIYNSALTGPLLRSLRALSEQSVRSCTKVSRPPPIYLCLERRDPVLVDQALSDAAKLWSVKRISFNKLSHAMEKGGLSWDKSDWDDVEVWAFSSKHT